MRKLTLTLMLLLVCALTGLGADVVASAGTPVRPAGSDSGRGAPGKWTQVSTGTVGITDLSSLYRGSGDVLHIAYAKEAGTAGQIGHTAVSRTGKTISQTDVLNPAWSTRVADPVILGTSSGLRMVFGGLQTTDAGYWSDGRMYEELGTADGTSWTLPATALGLSHSAYGSYGTAAVTMTDGTPVAAYVLNGDLVWHVGESETVADQSYTFGACCLYSTSMVRQGNDVWVAWYANGGSADTNGTFVKQILPTVGPTMKAPGSSQGVNSLPIGRVGLVARTGGGVYATYCVGYPNCGHLALWKVGASKAKAVPHSKYATTAALAAAPGGRIWVSWANNVPTMQAVRTSKSGGSFGPVRKVGMPKGKAAVYNVSADGATGRGDIVINVGDAFWHTQVYAQLKVTAKPGSWQHGRQQKVTFKVTDAGDKVAGAKVKVGSAHCTTAATGKCTITFARSFSPGKHKVVASGTGYAVGTTQVRVR